MRVLIKILLVLIGIIILSACRKKESATQGDLSFCNGGYGKGWTRVFSFNDSIGSISDACIAGNGFAYCLINKYTASSGELFFLYQSNDCGDSWSKIYTFRSVRVDGVFFTNKDHGFISQGVDSVYETSDGGKTWIGFVNDEKHIFPCEKMTSGIYRGIALNSQLLPNGILSLQPYISFNQGSSWQILPMGGYPYASYYGEESGYLSNGYNFYRTIDGGRNWDIISWAKSYKEISFTDNLHGLAIVDSVHTIGPPTWPIPYHTLYRTVDAGNHFAELNAPCTKKIPYYRDGLIACRSLNEVYIATSDGVYKSTDFGSTWTLDVSNAGTQKIIFDGNLGLAFAEDGIYKKN
jgi:photosystem II stability/assembly factor-like uncharacterized protein